MKKDSVALRIIFIAGIIILLLIPLLMIQSLINDRQQYRYVAIHEISKSWAGAQTIAGPMITVTTKKEKEDKKGKYGRYLGEIWLQKTETKFININDLIVKEGFAVYKDY